MICNALAIHGRLGVRHMASKTAQTCFDGRKAASKMCVDSKGHQASTALKEGELRLSHLLTLSSMCAGKRVFRESAPEEQAPAGCPCGQETSARDTRGSEGKTQATKDSILIESCQKPRQEACRLVTSL